MNEQEMTVRPKQFTLRVMKLIEALPRSVQGRSIAAQLMLSGTSVATNYQAACCARSKAEFISTLGRVEEEADESAFWLGLLIDAGLLTDKQVPPLLIEANEPVAIAAASNKTTVARTRSQIADRNLQIS